MRTDTHRPSAIEPEDYLFVAIGYQKIELFKGAAAFLQSAAFLQNERARLRAHMEGTGGTWSTHEHGGNCHVCGAHCIYTAVFYHERTNAYIRTGFDCAEKMDMGDAKRFRAFRKNVDDARKLAKGVNKARVVLGDLGMDAAWDIYQKGAAAPEDRDHFTVQDIVGKLVRYGSISDRQISFVRRLLDQIRRRPEIEAQREAERAAAADCPEGRIDIKGEVIKVAPHDSAFGTVLKMTVKTEAGFLVWGTVPVSLSRERELQRGDVVTFTASVRPSDKDPKFGFFSRPSGGRYVTSS